MPLSRRFLLQSAAAAAGVCSAHLACVGGNATAGHAQSGLVGMLIDSDREHLLAQLAMRIRADLDLRTLLGAVAEASVRQVKPYPHVGFKYHAFMVLHAVYLTTLLGRPEDRWPAVLWSADVFKASQAAEQRHGSWSLGPVRERLVPPPGKAEREFHRAMTQWDPEAADVAAVGLLRTLPPDRVFEILFRYGARDFRAIGHKAITAANTHRLMGAVSHDHAEPMVRSLVLALNNHIGEPNPANSDLRPDRPWRRNLLLSQRSSSDRRSSDTSAGDEVARMLLVLAEGSDENASRAVVASLDRGAREKDLWSAIFAAAGDLMLRQPGIISVHANTTSNALHYSYRHASDPATRRLLLLQAAAFLPLFRGLIDGKRRGPRIDSLAPSESSQGASARLEEIFAVLSVDPIEAARKTLQYLNSGGSELPLMTLARHYTVDRSTGYHGYKFTEAAFENAAAMKSPWRERYLASSLLYLNGSGDKPNETVARARALLG